MISTGYGTTLVNGGLSFISIKVGKQVLSYGRGGGGGGCGGDGVRDA